MLLKLFSQVLMTLDITISSNSFSAERDYECQILLYQIFFCIQTQKQLATFNNFWVLLKSVLIDLHACNLVHAKTSLHAHCMHTCHCAHNLSSPVIYFTLLFFHVSEGKICWNVSSVLMIREPLTVPTPCCTKPLSKVTLSQWCK